MIKAKCTSVKNLNDGIRIGETYNVESIHINSFITYVTLENYGKDYNSVQFDFFTPDGKEFYFLDSGEAGDVIYRFGTEIVHDYY